jgi:hypothetical protein
MSAIYDNFFEDTFTNTAAIDITTTAQVYIALSDDQPNYQLDSAGETHVSPLVGGGFQACVGTFTLTKAGGTGGGDITYANNNSSPQQFTGVTGTLSYVHLGWTGNTGTNITLICAFSSGTGFGSTLSSADVDITFDTGTNKIFKITS